MLSESRKQVSLSCYAFGNNVRDISVFMNASSSFWEEGSFYSESYKEKNTQLEPVLKTLVTSD